MPPRTRRLVCTTSIVVIGWREMVDEGSLASEWSGARSEYTGTVASATKAKWRVVLRARRASFRDLAAQVFAFPVLLGGMVLVVLAFQDPGQTRMYAPAATKRMLLAVGFVVIALFLVQAILTVAAVRNLLPIAFMRAGRRGVRIFSATQLVGRPTGTHFSRGSARLTLEVTPASGILGKSGMAHLTLTQGVRSCHIASPRGFARPDVDRFRELLGEFGVDV